MKHLFVIAVIALVWVSKSFFTIDDFVAGLNALPAERQAEAKVIVINSQRSFLGTWSNPYFLIYRK